MAEKLNGKQLDDLIGTDRAEDLRQQDQKAAKVYTHMELRTLQMRNVRRLIREVRPNEPFDQLTGETEVDRVGKKE